MATLITNITDVATCLAIKRTCQYITNEAWNTSGDFEYDYVVTKTKQHADDIKVLANMDLDISYGDKKIEVASGISVTKYSGEYNPWYGGKLTLEALIDCIEPLADNIDSIEPKYTAEAEFLFYFGVVRRKQPHPTYPKQEAITIHSLHPKIQEHCAGRYNSGYYSDAILAAYKVVLNEIKVITGLHDLDGTKLAEKALSLGNPLIKLNALATKSDKNEQLGFMQLLSGVVLGIRNSKAHDLVMQEDKAKTLSYLAFASLLMQRIDERYAPKGTNNG